MQLGIFLLALLLPFTLQANDSFLSVLDELLEQGDDVTLQVIDELHQLQRQYPQHKGRIQLELARLYAHMAAWDEAEAALLYVLSLNDLPSAVEARVHLLQASIAQWKTEPVWHSKFLISARHGRDYRVDDSFHSESMSLRINRDEYYVPLLSRTIQLSPEISVKGIQQRYREYGEYRYAEANIGVRFSVGNWRGQQELGVAQRYEKVGDISDTNMQYRFNRHWQSYGYWRVFRSNHQLDREGGVGLRWRFAPAWLVSWDLGKEDRLVDLYSYSTERFETEVLWRPGPIVIARYRQALKNKGYNEVHQRLIWPLVKGWSLTQGLSWQRDKGWRVASGYVGVQWKY